MKGSRLLRAALALALTIPILASATDAARQQDIHFIWMGGNDCPPCVMWRAIELPKLQQSAEFKSIRFSYVTKTIKSPVPSRMFLPPEVAPLKEKLDVASGGRSGSPKAAFVVNGEVYDFFSGARTAEALQSMIRAIRDGTPYPFKRCLKVSSQSGKCELAT